MFYVFLIELSIVESVKNDRKYFKDYYDQLQTFLHFANNFPWINYACRGISYIGEKKGEMFNLQKSVRICICVPKHLLSKSFQH